MNTDFGHSNVGNEDIRAMHKKISVMVIFHDSHRDENRAKKRIINLFVVRIYYDKLICPPPVYTLRFPVR